MMANINDIEKIVIPTEGIGSVPRTDDLMIAQRNYHDGRINLDRLNDYYKRATQLTIEELENTGSPVMTDGEQTKPSFLTYPIFAMFNEYYQFTSDCFSLKFADGHQRLLPRLIKAPFRYAIYAHSYVDAAKQITQLPIKQAVITPSALSMIYPKATIRGYSHEQFLNDLIDESERDIRLCLDSGAYCVQLDFTEARFSLKLDPTGQLLRDFVQINNQVLDRFGFHEQHRLGVHVCPGGDLDCYHSFDVDYLQVLPTLFELHVSNFYLQLASEPNHERVLVCIRKYMKPWHRIFVGVINPIDPIVETPEQVCARVLEAAKYIPVEQLGTTDDCGFSPFDDDQSTSRKIAFDKIRARVQGTHMAEDQLMMRKLKHL
ncbi:unnamed protein product [Rotaria socialis]|uniref:Cobalamin-independent methionine synthase MetE C-terminal/archaeal domain-containing protein n=1 Tax=Rotaria socialis TaxID=392032 RepID=A0A818BK33_9BILA|nr:unnamed protein product [Rotaria socialis]CAF3319832.1 unnamed protein product [Rotaria socialis]CAF3420125.1 unnamed protein product [Rotaria socialis]CAF3525243.1 unnamed protein product [Rotaria socialis]CAF4449663.1 unnamed protein product [Rotaria socialis]